MKTDKQFVQYKHPQAVCERHKNAEGKTIWIVKKKKGGDFISVSEEKSYAWHLAKEILQLIPFKALL
jgi:hypothetical protein